MSQDSKHLGQQWLEELLRFAGMPASVSVEPQVDMMTKLASPPLLDKADGELESCWLTIDETNLSSEQIAILLGTESIVLDAIQSLANTLLNLGQADGQSCSYTVELDGYRSARLAELIVMVEQAAAQVRQTRNEIELKALSSAERRQVHTLVKAYPDLETYSRGREPERYLVIRTAQS